MDPKDSGKDKAPASAAGRVRHDAGGRAIWEWAVDTGRHALESTSRLLKRLDIPELELEEDAKKRAAEQAEKQAGDPQQPPTFGGPREDDPKAGSRQSFNPYDSRTPSRPSSSAARPTPRPAAKQPAPAPAGKPGLLARLFGRR